jgi:hypothetical protein
MTPHITAAPKLTPAASWSPGFELETKTKKAIALKMATAAKT